MTRAADGLLKALSSSFGARLAMAALNYALFWDLSHRFDAATLGGYSVLMNLFFMLQALPLLGLSAPFARRTASSPEALPVELSNAWAFALPVAVLIGGGLAAAGRAWYDPALWPAFALLGASMLPTAWTLVAETALLGCERMSLVARVQCLEALGRMAGAVAVVAAGQGLTAVFAVFLVMRCVAALLYAGWAGLPAPRRALLSAALWRRNWREVPVFLGIALASVIATRVDVIALGQLVGLEAAGVYAAAARLFDAALMLPTIAAMVMLPALVRQFTHERERFGATLRQALRLSLGGGFAVALAVAALAQPLIALLYAPALHDAAAVLRVLIFGAVLMTADQLLSSTMTAAQAQHEDLRTMLLGVGSLALGLLLLVPWLGPLGAACAVPAALALRLGWRLRWAARTLALPGLWPDLGRLLLAWAVALAALAAGLRLGPWWALPLAWAAYALALWALGWITQGPRAPWHRAVAPGTSSSAS